MSPATFEHPVRLVVADMDGTLLDEDGEVPDDFWPLLARMRDLGVAFVPASGRQYATLARIFGADDPSLTEGMVFIAENGAYVVRDGVEVSSTPIELSGVVRIVQDVRALAAGGTTVGAVVCGKRSAYVEHREPAFLAEVARYYARLELVDDLTRVDDEVLKVALHSPSDVAALVLPTLEPLRATHQVVVSGGHWVDVMSPAATKGAALERLQAELGVDRAGTVVFGDYLNDLEMLDAADGSFAMADAHPEVLARARFRAPSHREQGVVTVLAGILATA